MANHAEQLGREVPNVFHWCIVVMDLFSTLLIAFHNISKPSTLVQVKIKYRTSTNLILRKGTLFYNEDMQTVEVESSGSDESMLGRFQGWLQVDTLVVSSCSQTANDSYWPFCVLRNTKVIKLSCLSTVKAIYHDRNWICEMPVVWLCLGMFGDSFRNECLRPWTTSKAHVWTVSETQFSLPQTVPNIESRKVSYTQIIPNPWMLKINNLE